MEIPLTLKPHSKLTIHSTFSFDDFICMEKKWPPTADARERLYAFPVRERWETNSHGALSLAACFPIGAGADTDPAVWRLRRKRRLSSDRTGRGNVEGEGRGEDGGASGEGESVSGDRPSPGSAWGEYDGILQGFQPKNGEHGPRDTNTRQALGV